MLIYKKFSIVMVLNINLGASTDIGERMALKKYCAGN
jgi:hypothetical protein